MRTYAVCILISSTLNTKNGGETDEKYAIQREENLYSLTNRNGGYSACFILALVVSTSVFANSNLFNGSYSLTFC